MAGFGLGLVIMLECARKAEGLIWHSIKHQRDADAAAAFAQGRVQRLCMAIIAANGLAASAAAISHADTASRCQQWFQESTQSATLSRQQTAPRGASYSSSQARCLPPPPPPPNSTFC